MLFLCSLLLAGAIALTTAAAGEAAMPGEGALTPDAAGGTAWHKEPHRPSAQRFPAPYCADCHDDLTHYRYLVNAPKEVPAETMFYFNVTVRNEEKHTVRDLTAEITLSKEFAILGSEQEDQEFVESGSVGMFSTQTYTFTIAPGAENALIDLNGQAAFINDIDLVVNGPGGGSWSSSGSGVDESVTLDAATIENEGYGEYTAEVSHQRGIRATSFDLRIVVEYGSGGAALLSGPALGPGDEHVFSWQLVGLSRGEGSAEVEVKGTAFYKHDDGDREEAQEYTESATAPIKVGDRFVYGENKGFSNSVSFDDLLGLGRFLGIIAGLLFIAAVATRLVKTIRAKHPKLHCRISYAMGAAFLLHWILLWLGPYGSMLGGIGSGAVMLGLIVVLTISGKWPKALGGRIPGVTNQRIHAFSTVGVFIILTVHAVLNGTEFAFLRSILNL